MIIRNNDINTDENIFKTIYKINTQFKSIRSDPSINNGFVSIIFDDDIWFVSPVFFSLLLLTHEKYIENNIALVIDILGFNNPERYKEKTEDPRQSYVLRFLLPFFNSPYFKLEFTENEIDYLRASYTVIIPDRVKRLVSLDENQKSYKKLIYLFCSKKPKDFLFLNKSHSGTFLPIVKLTNFSNFFYDSDFYNDNKDDFDKRKNIFKSLTIDNEKNLKNLKDNFKDNFINYVKPKDFDSTLLQPLQDVFFEMVDNIKRHAEYDDKSFADSYFNFYYDDANKNFKFHIVDNFNTGFINTYIKTFSRDIDTLRGAGFSDDKSSEKAKETLIDSKNDISLLESLFSAGGWFYGSQVPRILFHFGIPLLAKIVKDTGGSAYIRLYRETNLGNIFYEVTIDKHGTKARDITETYQNIEGTYISITIPNVKHEGLRTTRMVLSYNDYKNITDKKDEITERVKKFINESKKIEKKTCAIYNYTQYTEGTISDFIRKISLDSYTNETKDILVVGIDLKEYKSYFETLIYLLYINDNYAERTTTSYEVSNILFWDKSSFDILFIGGKNKDEFYTSNKILRKHYKQNINFLKHLEPPEDITAPADSMFFFKTENDFIIIPFETIGKEIETYSDILDKMSVQRTIITKLEEDKETVHFDTKRKFHVDVYYKFATIFQDSSYFGRLADELKNIMLADAALKGKTIVLIGVGKYLNLFMALLLQLLENEKIKLYKKYEVFDSANGSDEKIKHFIQKAKTDNLEAETVFVLVTAVSFGGKKVEEFRKEYLASCPVHWYNNIKLSLEKINAASTHLDARANIINIEIPEKLYHSVKGKGCKICNEPDIELPLLSIDDKDEFKLKKTYFGKYVSKEFTGAKKVDSLKWYNTIAFGHIKRGNSNHYLYYTKTIQFFKDNKNNIVSYLELIGKIENPADAIIIIPMHTTLNKFTSLVHNMMFGGNAKIFQLDTKKGIKNYHELKEQITDPSNYKFYFIDDEISSGATLEYFYSLLRYLGEDGFEKIFVMIDRMDVVDEKLCINYLKSKDKKDIHCFAKLEIKPIKTAVEDCFLCETKEMYKEVLKQASIDMNRFAIAERIVKLNLLDANFVDFEDSKDLSVLKFRIYLKMYAVDYIYEKFDEIDFDYKDEYYDRNIILKRYQDFESKFIKKVKGKINALPFKKKTTYEGLLNDIGEYEGRIALLKALSFPKLVYYYSLRYMLTIVLIENIKGYLTKDAVTYYFDYEKMKDFMDAQKDEKYKKFLEHFHKKVNMNYLSFLYKTASYLDIHYVIHEDNVKYYHKASQQIKDRDEGKGNDEHSLEQCLVEYYQLAAKRVASYSNDRAEYFQKNIQSVLPDDENINLPKKKDANDGYDKLLKALLIENHYDKEIVDFLKQCHSIFKEKDDFKEMLISIENILKKRLENDSIKFHAVFVNQYTNLSYENYAAYISKMHLVNVMGNYEEPLKKDDDLIYRLTKGYLSKFKQETFDPNNSDHKKHIHNTWSNKYIENYILQNDKTIPITAIKLVDINPKMLEIGYTTKRTLKTLVSDNKTLWYKPIGAALVTYKDDGKKNKYLHWRLSKYILSIQNEFVKYLNGRFSTGVIQEALSEQGLKEYMRNYNHNIGSLLNISEPFKNHVSQYFDLLDKPTRTQAEKIEGLESDNYSVETNHEELGNGIELLEDYLYAPPLIARVAQLGSVVKIDTPCDINIMNFIKDEKDAITKAIKRVQKISNAIGDIKSFNINIEPGDENFIIKGTSKDDIRAIIFELCFNASKYSSADIWISFKVKNDILIIANNVGVKNCSVKTTMGQDSIKEYLQRLDCEIIYPNKSSIKIGEEYTVEIKKG